MLKRIVVAFDGSELSREAFAYSELMAEAGDIDLEIVHLLEPIAPPVVGEPLAGVDVNPVLVADTAQAERDLVEERAWAEQELRSIKQFCESRGRSCATTIEEGRLSHWLTRNTEPRDLIALGAKGRFKRSGFGSSTRALVKSAPCPVMVVACGLKPVNRILAIYDGTEVSERAGVMARELAGQCGWPLSILAVTSKKLSIDDSLERAQMLSAEAQVISFGAVGASEAEQIEEAADHARHALVVIGAYPDSVFHQLFFGGTTGHVISHVDAPVILVP